MKTMKNKLLAALLLPVMLLSLAACKLPSVRPSEGSTGDGDFSRLENSERPDTTWPTIWIGETQVPAYTGIAFTVVEGNLPVFTEEERTAVAYESYAPLDELGRCGVAIASCGLETMPRPDEDRGSISSVKPSGWVQAQYDFVSGGYLWNRAHLIGWQLSAENANRMNLITGTYYMNHEGMLPFENMVADYIKETENHVAYRITPIFLGDNLVCHGVQMEAYSIEDEGEGLCFNVFIYNVEPGVVIDYATGNSYASGEEPPSTENEGQGGAAGGDVENGGGSEGTPEAEEQPEKVYVTDSGTRYHTSPTCSGMVSPQEITRAEAEARGYEDCKRC